ncbi:CHAT domain-containing protein [Pseudanabaena sp. UWO311]|uniref:CHAT domain-containing protein n=1 Tax=Pseudanabaena sp. UWO311 TaxID=2487337 RepID=UPI00115A1EA1|nr:CHAT domain-containing protein [Pseudanabaena sp. UWO311]TYQ28629.1 CHAT domain-containing protein [Pseudanabaena sp. UWO311]
MSLWKSILKIKLKIGKFLGYASIATCTTLLAILAGWNPQPSIANPAQNSPKVMTDIVMTTSSTNPSALIETGKQQYQNGQYTIAIATWQQALDIYTKQSDRLNQAVAFNNLALAYQQLGQWTEANQAIANSLKILQADPQQLKLLAQAQNIQGNIQLAQGQAQAALTTWQKATATYEQIGDKDGAIRSRINQSQAMRSLGLYPKAKETLTQILKDNLDSTSKEKLAQILSDRLKQLITNRPDATILDSEKENSISDFIQVLKDTPDSALKASLLLNLGDTLQLNSDLPEALQALENSIAIAQKLNNTPTLAEALLSIGNIAKSQIKDENLNDPIEKQSDRQQLIAQATSKYQQAVSLAISPLQKVQVQLNQLQLQIAVKQIDTARLLAAELQSELPKISPSHDAIYARINFVQSWLKLNLTAKDLEVADQIIAVAAQQARDMGNPRAESYAIGYQGHLAEQKQLLTEAQRYTEKALVIAQTNNASDISYQWQWQLGRLLAAKGETKQAIVAYSEAVSTLTSIRGELVSSNADVQFSFSESIEPVYRQLVTLLLTHDKDKEVSQDNLKEARKVIESLQLAELDNFFKEACLTGKSTQIDEVDRQAAVVYPIILPESIEVVISLPDKERTLLHKTSRIAQKDLEILLGNLRQKLSRTALESGTKKASQEVYDLLLGKEIEAKLKEKDIKTLAFVLDGSLRNLPMAILYDGNQYLIEKYNLALTPGLQLLDPRPLKRQKLEVFVGGVSEETQKFNALPNVENELKQISSIVSTQPPLLNQSFTSLAIQNQISLIPYRVVHLATHGQFSSDLNETYVLTWDDRLDVRELGELLQTKAQDSRVPIELLVLSACKTAKGDKRAALGLAGMAIRSGARSTIASLWSVEDSATAKFMEIFYQELAKTGTTKADALRNAQISLLKNSSFRHPFYWSPFVLIGNWL